jgi:hypothetical protein
MASIDFSLLVFESTSLLKRRKLSREDQYLSGKTEPFFDWPSTILAYQEVAAVRRLIRRHCDATIPSKNKQ